MTHPHPDDSDASLREILTGAKVIALVGFSPNPARPSHGVARYLMARGYTVIPVNPGHAGEEILGARVYADLASIPADAGVDMVDIFRRSDAVPPVVEEALRVLPGLRTVWMQLGVTHEGAAGLARAKGVKVVQNRCPAIEIPRLID